MLAPVSASVLASYPPLVVPIVTAFLTVSLGGIVAALVTFFMNRAHSEMVFIRSKFEDLYLAVDEYGRRFISTAFAYHSVSIGKLDWNQCNDLIQSALSKDIKSGGFETVQMLISIYFPQLLPRLEAIKTARSEHAAVVGQLRSDYDGGRIQPETKRLVVIVTDNLNKVIEDTKEEIRTLASSRSVTHKLAVAWRKKPRKIRAAKATS